MAATFGVCPQSPPVLGRPVDRVFEDAQFSGEVNLSGRKLRDYPKICAKYDLADTIHADLSKNRLNELPMEVCDYRYMERLNCYHNTIRSIPAAIAQLQALTHLNLSRNQLTILPVSVCALASLEVLLLSNNKLVSLPEEISRLENLMDLDVSCNEISRLPPQIGDLRSLRSLNLRRNFLVELPLDICKLNLSRLEISRNRIQKIPTVFRKMEVLEQIFLEHNPLESPPAHLCTRGRQHILKFLHMEAIREDRRRGLLSDSDMKRLLRKSLPNQAGSDELRNILEAPEAKWKRHTVLSSDSGYSTADSLDRSGFNQTELEQGIVGDVDDSNVLAIKAAEVVREQRQSHSHTITMDATTPPTSQSPLPHSKPASPDLVNGRLSSSPLPSNHDNRSLGDEGVVSDIQSPEADASRLNDRSQLDTSHSGQRQPQLEGQSDVKPQLEGQSEVKPQTQSPEDSGEFSLASVSQGVEHRLRKVSVTPHVEGRGQPSPSSPSECEEGQGGQGGPTPQGTPPATPPATPPTPLAPHQVMSVDEDQFSRELQLQKEEYEQRKKEAEQIRIAQEEKECDDRKKAGQKAPEIKHHTPPDLPREDSQRKKGKRRQQTEHSRLEPEQLQKVPEQQKFLERRAREEEEVKLREEEGGLPEKERGKTEHSRQTEDGQKNKDNNKNSSSSQNCKEQTRRIPNSQYRRTASDSTPRRGIPTAIGSHRQADGHGHSSKSEMVEETNHDPTPSHNAKVTDPTATHPSMPHDLQSRGEHSTGGQIPVVRRSKGGDRWQVPTPTSARSSSKASSSSSVNSSASQEGTARNAGIPATAATPPPPSSTSTRSKNNTPTSTPKNARRAAARSSRMYTEPGSTFSRLRPPSSSSDQHEEEAAPKPQQSKLQTPSESPRHKSRLEDPRSKTAREEDSPHKHQQARTQTSTEPQRFKSRLEEPRSRTSAGAKKSGSSENLNKRQAGGIKAGATTAGKHSRSDQQSRLHLSNGRVSGLPCKQSTGVNKSLEDVTSPYGSRRRGDHHRDSDSQQTEQLRQIIETRLKVTLPDNLPDALKDGVVLCHLANQIRPRSVATIHVPSPAVPKLTSAKCRRNVESFLEACRKIGLDQEQVCTVMDIMDERGTLRVASTVLGLVAAGSNP